MAGFPPHLLESAGSRTAPMRLQVGARRELGIFSPQRGSAA